MQSFNQEGNLANWMGGEEDLPAFSMLPDPNNGDFGGAEAGASTNTGNETTSDPIDLVDGGEANSYGSLEIQTPYLDGQNVSTTLSVCNDIHTNQYGSTLLLDPTLFSDGVTPFPGQDPIGFNHWGGFQAGTWPALPNFASPYQENVVKAANLSKGELSTDRETMIHPFELTDHICFPIDTLTGFHNLPNPSMMDLNPQQPYGLMVQTTNGYMTNNSNVEEASASIQVPAAAPVSQAAAAAQINPSPVTAASTRPVLRCSIPWCTMTFKRKHERDRHSASVHGINHRAYLCHVNGCPKNRGTPFSRQDKLTEHMWKQHGDLGYAKRVL